MPSRQPLWESRDRVVDVVAALVLAIGAVADAVMATTGSPEQSALAVALAVVSTATVATRRAASLVSAWVCLGAVALYEVATGDPRFTFEPYAVLLVLYTVGRTEREGRLAHRWVLVGAAVAFLVVVTASGQAAPTAVSAFAVFAGVPYGVGVLVTRREGKAEQLATRIALLHDEQDLRGRAAAHAERMRVARELHDVAAHCLTAMVVQAAAARVVALQDPHGAAEALGTLTSSGRTALSELRRLADLPLDPQASPAHAGLEPFLSSLADDVSVELAWPEGRRTIPAAVGPVAVRVVQEGLTNAARHAPGAKVSVRVSVGADVLDVRVANGPAVRSAGGAPGGYGLLGMRERVAALRGSVSTGPTAAGGYAVHARLPLDTDTAEPVASTPRPRTRDRVLGVGVPLACSAVLVTEAVVSDHRVGPVVLNVLVVAVMGLAGLLRRRAPVAFLVVVGALSLLLSAGLTSRDYATLTGLYTAVVPAYAVGCWAARRRAVAAMALWGVAATAAGMAQHAHPAGLLGPLMTAGLAACLGALVQEHRTMEQRLAAAENAVREQTLVLEQMSAESERTRLAERHDHDVARVVAHMLDLATTAARLHEAGDPRLVAALAEIESEGRGALERMRAIVGSLRASPDESLVAAPVPA